MVSLLRGFGLLIAAADEMKADRVFRLGGRLLVALAALQLPLGLVYAWRGLDWAALVPDALSMLAAGLIGLGLAQAVHLRRRLRAI